MKRLLILVIVTLINPVLQAQNAKETAFEKMKNLAGGSWTYEGQWPNGKPFRQEYIFEWGLDKQILKVQTYGTINMETGEHGLRNEGIRAWDDVTGSMRFWEFDVFGGVTEGVLVFEGDIIHYEYEYEIEGRNELFRDSWEYVDKNTYLLSVKMKIEEGWKVFTSNELIREE